MIKQLTLYGLGFGVIFFAILLWHSLQELRFLTNRVQEDIIFNDGAWDTSLYNADPLLPGSSPIYILANDGFVIERWKPIAGYLDTSDFKHLLAFSEIQTIQTSSQQDWRVFSLPITSNGHVVGVVTVSYYHTVPSVLTAFDDQMKQVASMISDHILVEGEVIKIESLDERKIPHHISFQVVNQFNTIVLKGNNSNSIDRLPNFIDPSYVAAELKKAKIRLVRDTKTNEVFIIHGRPMFDKQGAVKGIAIIGKNVTPLIRSLADYLVLVVVAVVVLVGQRHLRSYLQKYKKMPIKPKESISFDEKNSAILFGNQKIYIAYASNQYYLCSAILKKQAKRWEVDELLDLFGAESHSNDWRKIYDAMNQVNKKAFPVLGKKLILLEEKTYRLNPDLL